MTGDSPRAGDDSSLVVEEGASSREFHGIWGCLY